MAAGDVTTGGERFPWPGYVGRADEVGVLRHLVDEVVQGRGRSVLVDGEPGIGKSTLLATALSGAKERGCQVFWCAADMSPERLPLRVLADGLGVDLAQLPVGAAGAGPDPADHVPVMARSLLERVDRICAVGPAVLVLDDLHNADDVSLLVLNRLSRSLGQLPLLLAVAGRPVQRRPKVAALRRTLLTRGAVRLALQPLPESQVVELVGRLVHADVGPALRRLAAGAGGNPLCVREAVEAHLRDGRVRVERGTADLVGEAGPVPASISLTAAIDNRLRELPPAARSLLQWAALLGTDFAAVDLVTVAHWPATEVVVGVEQAVAGGILVESAARLAFRHPMLRQVLYESIPVRERATLHRRVARSLADAGAPAERVAQVLLASARPVEEWVLAWLTGALPALTQRAPKLAADLTARVLDRMPADDPRREQLTTNLVTVLRLLARYDDVERVARPFLATVTDPQLAGQTAWTLAFALLFSTKPTSQAIEVAEEALRRWPAVVPWAARLRALLALLILQNGYQVDRATAIAERAMSEGEQAGDRFAVGFGLHVLAVLTGSTSEALTRVDRALTVVGDVLDGADLRLLLSANKSRYLTILGRAAEAQETLQAALALAERTGTPRLLTLRSEAASVNYLLGRWDDTLVELEIAFELLEDRPISSYEKVKLNGLAALIAAHRDDRATAERHLAVVGSLPLRSARLQGYEMVSLAHALLAEGSGRFDVGLVRLVSLIRRRQSAGPDRDRPHLLPVLVRIALAARRDDAARWATGLSDEDADVDRAPFAVAAARRCHGLLDASVADLRAAVDAYRTLGALPALAGSLEDLAVVCGRRGEVQPARAAYAEAAELYRGLGAALDLRRAGSRLQPYGIGTGRRGEHARPEFGWYALTPTERRIAQLVAEGLSNPDIAAELVLSRRTVQSHVSHILTKLTVRSRAEIAHEAGLSRNHPRSPRDRPAV